MMEIHPFANIFPLLDGEPFEQLVQDIEEQGLREPILLYDGKILDGRNRYFACAQLGIEPRFEDSSASCDEEAFRESISRNLHRRHLTASQRAMIGAEILPMFEELAKKRQAHGQTSPGQTLVANLPQASRKAREDVAEAVGASARSIQSAKKVKERGVEQLVEAVQDGSMAVSTAAEVASLDADQQIEVIELVGEGEKPREALRLVKGAPAALLSSKSNEWYTPSPIVEAARALMGGIDLDPASCAQANKTIKAARVFSIEEDGLSQDWRGRVWLNPPYGREGGGSSQAAWSSKLIESFEAGDVSEAVMLVNSATGARWFKPLFEFAICFVEGRISFDSPVGRKDRPTHYSALVYFGPNVEAFHEHFYEFGHITPDDRRAAVVIEHTAELSTSEPIITHTAPPQWTRSVPDWTESPKWHSLMGFDPPGEWKMGWSIRQELDSFILCVHTREDEPGGTWGACIYKRCRDFHCRSEEFLWKSSGHPSELSARVEASQEYDLRLDTELMLDERANVVDITNALDKPRF